VPLDGAKLASDQSAYMLMTIMVMGVRLRLWTVATKGPIVHPPVRYEYGEP
jgi:hypothetical protein